MNILRLAGILTGIGARRRFKVGQPRMLTYIVTFACNSRCIMCDSWKKPAADELRLEEIESILRQLPALDFVRLSGGEPFVRADFFEIAHLIQDCLRPMRLHITTNGFLTDRIVRFCEQRHKSVPLDLLVSLDGMANTHNRIRGRESAWAAATATLRALAPRQQELRLSVSINHTIVDAEGAADYGQLNALAKNLGIRHSVVIAYRHSATYSVSEPLDAAPKAAGEFTPFGQFRNGQIESLLDEVEAAITKWPWPERVAKRYYIRGIRNRLLHGRGSPNPPCVALNSHLRILPNGDVPTCQFNTRSVGNLRKQSFQEVWSGAEIRRQRAWVQKCPGCWAECEVIPSAIYTGDLWRNFRAL